MKEWYERDQEWYPTEYGKDDVLGTYNHVTPDKVLKAATLVEKGQGCGTESRNIQRNARQANGTRTILLSSLTAGL